MLSGVIMLAFGRVSASRSLNGYQCPEAAVLLACVAKVLEMERIRGREGIQ
jgi:hypothetical protein